MFRFLLAAALPLLATAAAAAPLPRAEVPIREVVLSNGARRYAVPLMVGATPVEVGLDTGSTGLRILPGVLADGDARGGSRAESYGFSAGVRLEGVIGTTRLTIGSRAAPATVQLIRTLGCTQDKPNCGAHRIPLGEFGIQGDGLPGEGFKAIFGTNMADADIGNPLMALGARRWLVDLPRPGETAPGRLVLDPDDAEVAAYVGLPLLARFGRARGGMHDAVPGCLINDTTRVRLCGAVLFDSGAPGIRVVMAMGDRAWPDGTPATLALTDANGHVRAAERLTIGLRAHASRLTFEQERPGGSASEMPLIYAGIAPYLAFSVLYDPRHDVVAVAPRQPVAGGPVGSVQ